MLQKALKISMEAEAAEGQKDEEPNLDAMTEEEQLAYAQQLSLQQPEEPMDVSEKSSTNAADGAAGDDYTEVMNDPEFLHTVLGNLPGVDPESEAIRNAMDSMTKEKKEDKDKKK